MERRKKEELPDESEDCGKESCGSGGRNEEIFEKGAAEGAKKGREIEEKAGKSAKDRILGGILSLQRGYIRNEC